MSQYIIRLRDVEKTVIIAEALHELLYNMLGADREATTAKLLNTFH